MQRDYGFEIVFFLWKGRVLRFFQAQYNPIGYGLQLKFRMITAMIIHETATYILT